MSFNVGAPTPLRLAMASISDQVTMAEPPSSSLFMAFGEKAHDAHPPLANLVLLVFEAVMEVVCVSLPGYIIARMGHFDADKQKFLANLNVMLFTPCLIFTKLASQLNGDKLIELGVIPVIFVIQTLVSYFVATLVAKCFRLNRRASNFVTAMGVFGNSNSLPISLVLSLSQTIQGLHWDKIPGDNDDDVGARGILYLLIFQQLGQLVRWSWGYHVLLAPKDTYEEYNCATVEEGRYHQEEVRDEEERQGLIQGIDSTQEMGDERFVPHYQHHHHRSLTQSSDSDLYEPAGRTPTVGTFSLASPNDSDDEDRDSPRKRPASLNQSVLDGNEDELFYRDPIPEDSPDGIMSFPRIRNTDEPQISPGVRVFGTGAHLAMRRVRRNVATSVSWLAYRVLNALPPSAQDLLAGFGCIAKHVSTFLREFLNPPLWAMLIAVLVASVPSLQRLFFKEGSFITNSVTSAVRSSGAVAVPLILVVLGANLAQNTQKQEHDGDPEEKQLGTRLLVASLISRMLLPTLIMTPILALSAKYVPISILDDPIFVIVCFLLTGAPSALQLAQICQINGVFEGVMGKILFQSYVIWILPSTLVLVMCALEVVEWAH